ncbi:MAG: hypothetical protein ABI261_01070 [Ginsengibacter sp.]
MIISERKYRLLNTFWIALIIFLTLSILSGFSLIPQKLADYSRILIAIGLLAVGGQLIKLSGKNSFLQFIFLVYLAWQIGIIARGGLTFDFKSFVTTLISPSGYLPYLVPIIVLFPVNLNFYKKLFEIIFVAGIIFLCLNVLFIKYLLDRSFETQNVIESFATLSIPSGFFLLTYKYHSFRKNIILVGVMVISLLFSIYKARRGLSSITLAILISSYFIYLIETKRKIVVLYFSVLCILLTALKFSDTYRLGQNKLLGFMMERGEADTRTGVELYFYADMDHTDWIIGKGFDGKYFCPNVDRDQVTDYRSYIETGYLNIILKGGIVSLSLYLIILVPAVFLNLFFSKNMLSKAAGIWIIISIIELYPTSIAGYDLNYLLVWISVGIGYSRQVRNLSNQYLTDFFKNPYRIAS